MRPVSIELECSDDMLADADGGPRDLAAVVADALRVGLAPYGEDAFAGVKSVGVKVPLGVRLTINRVMLRDVETFVAVLTNFGGGYAGTKVAAIYANDCAGPMLADFWNEVEKQGQAIHPLFTLSDKTRKSLPLPPGVGSKEFHLELEAKARDLMRKLGLK